MRPVTALPDSSPEVLPHLAAGLLLAARDHQRHFGLVQSSVEEIVEKTGASRSSAYEIRARLHVLLPSLVRPVGRPPAPETAPPQAADAICHEVLRFVMEHPGCVHGSVGRRQYSDCFRHLVLGLHERHSELGIDLLARAVEVPLDTLRDWLRMKTTAPAPSVAAVPGVTADAERARADSLHIETVLAAWKSWDGDFSPFCDHVRQHLRVPFGKTAIAAILETHRVRRAQRRSGRSPDETALRKSFELFFPGAQWVGDGTPVAITLLGERFTFNFELIVDAFSAAFTGASLRDEEDSVALIEAVEDGKNTTGGPPIALLVDNRPSNLTSQVEQVLGDETLLIPATRGRPQNKGHVEGAFGLFFQSLPALVLSATNKRELAREILRLVITTWGRTLNGRPRVNRGGKSRLELYADLPTPEQIERARLRLEERLRRQMAARKTQQARLDPAVRLILTVAFARLALADPDGKLQDALARYPLQAVLNGIAIFEGRGREGSLPPDVDARYLLGIVRNLAQEREAELISETMLRMRLEVRDTLFGPLAARKETLLAQHPDAPGLLAQFVDHAIDAHQRHIDRIFWLLAAAAVLCREPEVSRPDLYRLAARRINTAFRIPYADRLSAVRFLANKAFPVE
jgi:hypothetical protein